MIECFYYKDGKKINDVQTLIAEFFKDTSRLENSAIFSAEEIQESTIKLLKNLEGATKYNASKKRSVIEVISTPNPGLFTKVGIKTKNGLLAPEYIEENRIHQYVLDNLGRLAATTTIDVDSLIFTKEKFDRLKNDPAFNNVSEDKLKFLLNEIEADIRYEQLINKLGIFMHTIIGLKTRGTGYTSILNTFLTDPENAEIFGDFSVEEWTDKIEEITDSIIATVRKTGVPISELFITSDGKNPIDTLGKGIKDTTQTIAEDGFEPGVKGRIDLIAVDKSGVAHIFEIKISKTPYLNWDSAKLLTLDWQLALYRQLLGQHINISKTMLYVLPIIVKAKGNPNGIFFTDGAINRKTTSASGLNDAGRITAQANLLIPRRVFGTYDPVRMEKITNQLHALIPNYEIKTGIDDLDVDKIIENARNRFKREGVWRKWNNFSDIPGLEKGYIEELTEEAFREKIESYVAFTKTQVNRNVSILRDAITSAIKTGDRIKTNASNPEKDQITNHLLLEYLNDAWDIIDTIPEALAMGLIILRNVETGNINIISLTANELYADSIEPSLEGKNYGDLEFLKSFLFANAFKNELFPQESGKLAQIIVYNPVKNKVYSRNTFEKYDEFKAQMYKAGLQDELILTKESNVMGIEDIALYNLDLNLRQFSGADRDQISAIFSKFQDVKFTDINLETLLDIQKTLFATFPGYKEKTMTPTLNFDDPKEVLFALLQVAIVTNSQLNPQGDFQNLTTYSMGFSDFRSLLTALYSDNIAKYNKEGKRIQGMVQGLVWTTPDWVASKDLRNINKMMSTANQHIGEDMLKISEVINAHTINYYKSLNLKKASLATFGETQSRHADLFLQNNGTVANEFKTKNPYVDDNANSLSENRKDYLKNMLFVINSFRYNVSDEEAKRLDINSLESLMSNAKLARPIETGEYFEMPLIRREEITRYQDVFTSVGRLWQDKVRPFVEEFKIDLLDSRELLPDQLDNIQKQKMGFYEMYDVYGRQDSAFTAKAIEKHSVNYFEWNLDTIAHRIAFNKIRKMHMDRQLPIINAYVWWLKLLSGKEGVDVSNQLDYIANQMSLSIYDEPIIADEAKDFAKVTAVLKKVSTMGLLAFRPALFVKEMTVGLFRGVSLAATQLYGKDQFTLADFGKAMGKMLMIDNKFTEEFNLIDKLNQFYRFANMDVNTIAQKLQTDRHGLFKGAGRYMYMSNTAPDYYNRMVIFLAKMIHDGSYDAHSIENGVFTYDASKDKRFSHYLANRANHMKDGKYVSATDDAEYNRQRRTYLLIQEQLTKEYNGTKTFTEYDTELIPKAYSEVERSSLKSFTDMAYGYYDKDAQAQANNVWWGMTWLQFMQFWPAKMRMWFANPTNESPMGRIAHKSIVDADGVKKLQYHKTVEREDGSIYTIEVDEDTGDPVLEWTGTPYEGLYYSIVGTIKDILTLDFSHIKNSEERNKRVLLALADAGLIFMLFKLFSVILESFIEENGTEGVSGTLASMSHSINKKVLNEYNVWESTLGAPSSDPVFLSWGRRMAQDIWSAIGGEKDVTDVMTKNIGAAEVFRW